jgi:hypothetical protein
MGNDRGNRINDIQEGNCLGTRAPCDNAPSFVAQFLKAISPACDSCAERSIERLG